MKFEKKSTEQQTVASLNRSVANSKVRRYKIKLSTTLARSKKIFNDYRLPALTTIVFILLVIAMAAVRQFERTSLLALISEVTDGESGYSTLLSSDQRDEFVGNGSVSEDTTEGGEASENSVTSEQITDSTQSTSTSFSLDSPSVITTPSTGGTDGGSGNNNNSGNGSEPDTEPPTLDPFEASIDSFNQQSSSLTCSNPSKPRKGSCSKIYVFQGGIRTVNGPGSVSYAWQSNISGGGGNGSFSAVSGTSITTVSKELTLACAKETTFTMQLALTSPSSTPSNVITINHVCDEI